MLDAWASWYDKGQRWELHTTFDQAYCNECDGETTLKQEDDEAT